MAPARRCQHQNQCPYCGRHPPLPPDSTTHSNTRRSLLLQAGDVEENPGPGPGPASSAVPHQDLLVMDIQASGSRDQWKLEWPEEAYSGPCGTSEPPTPPKGVLLTCQACYRQFYVRQYHLVSSHCCWFDNSPPHTPPGLDPRDAVPPRPGAIGGPRIGFTDLR